MTLVFLCGPLGQTPLAALVLGCAPGALSAASLGGHQLVSAGAEHAVAAPGEGAVPGLLARVDDSGVQRLRYYLAVYGLTLGQARLDGSPVQLPAVSEPGGPWMPVNTPVSSEQQDALTEAARDILAHQDRYDAAEMAQRMGALRGRARLWAQSRAQAPTGFEDVDRDVIVQAEHRPYLNYFAAREVDLQFRRRDGTMSRVVNRGALIMGEASAVLPYDPVQDKVLVIRQFRAPLYMGGARSPWIREPVAGMVDAGETPEDAARREAMEEAGLTLRHLECVGPSHASPGALADRLVLFIGLTDLTDLAAGGGVDSEEEDIAREILSFDALMQGIDSQAFRNLPLIALALWLARHRDRLRALA